MSVIYNGSHSITFIEAFDSDTDSTPTIYSSYKRSWRDFHLIPEKRPSVNPPTPSLKLIEIPGTSKRIDLTDLSPGGLKFGRRQGEWQFILDHDLWDNWHIAKKTIEDAINGKRLYCILEDDFNTAYRGRFRVKSWQSGPDYSSISISYDLEYKKYTNAFSILDDATENRMLSSWIEVDKMIQDGSYRNNIAIGDSCYFCLPGEYNGYADVIGIDADTNYLYDSVLPITWITKKLLRNNYQFETSLTRTDGYPPVSDYYKSKIGGSVLTHDRTRTDGIYRLFPARLQKMVKLSTKYTYLYIRNSGVPVESAFLDKNSRVNLRLWIPSYREIFGGTIKESEGPVYSTYFNSNERRRRSKDADPNDNISFYALRSSYTRNSYCLMDPLGEHLIESEHPLTYYVPILLGFCTGAST